MNCPESLDLLQRRLDGERPGDLAPLEQHLGACPSCRERHSAATLLLEGLKGRGRPAPREGLGVRIFARVLADQRARRRRALLQRATALAAGLLLVAAGTYFLFRDSPQDPPGNPVPPVVARQGGTQPPEKDLPLGEELPSLPKSVAEARVAVASLTERLAQETREKTLTLWLATNPLDASPLPSLAALPALDSTLAPARQTFKETGQGVGEGLEVVANSARRAVQYFFVEFAPQENRGN